MTTETKHTPGPWEHDGTGIVYGQPEDETGGSRFVCDVVQDGAREWMDDTEKANAQLIASAPQMKDAISDALRDINDVLRAWDQPASKEQLEATVRDLRAILAKARGEPDLAA